MGVGPEQNFTYIASLKPSMVFIVDIRRGNLDLHLMYKALFDLSKDRADFLSRLFSRKRPEGLMADASVTDLFRAFSVYSGQPLETELFTQNLMAIVDNLQQTHHLPLTDEDLVQLKYILGFFAEHGPDLTYWMSGGYGGPGRGGFGRNSPTYA